MTSLLYDLELACWLYTCAQLPRICGTAGDVCRMPHRFPSHTFRNQPPQGGCVYVALAALEALPPAPAPLPDTPAYQDALRASEPGSLDPGNGAGEPHAQAHDALGGWRDARVEVLEGGALVHLDIPEPRPLAECLAGRCRINLELHRRL